MACWLNLLSAPNDIVKSGLYTIEFCGSMTTTVQDALKNLWIALQPALQDLLYGSASPAYNAFFKDSIYSSLIEEMLTNITTGTPILKWGSFTWTQDEGLRSPFIACTTEPGNVIIPYSSGAEDAFSVCQASFGLIAFHLPKSDLIVLCPAFFQLPDEITNPKAHCPPVLGNIFWEKGATPLTWTKPFALMHEILHFYLWNEPAPATNSATEVNDWNGASELSALNALSNAHSYVAYAAGKWSR